MRRTWPWARLAGIAALAAAVLTVVDALMYLILPHAQPANAPPYFAALGEGVVVAGAVVNFVIYGFSGWFALQYGRGLAASLGGADAARLEAALWWQRRYWTLQGVLMIIFIAIFVLTFIAAVLIGVFSVIHQQGL